MALTQRVPDRRVVLLEKENTLAAHQSGRNSGVIHSGVYYRPGSLKAKTCVAGAAEMVRFCRDNGVLVEVCGKLIVATRPEEVPSLAMLRDRGEANGLTGLRLLSPGELREREPHATGVAALWVPSTGITDYAAVTQRYAEIAARQGAEIHLNAGVTAIHESPDEVVAETANGEFRGSLLINCGGLQSDLLARKAGVDTGLRIIPFRGEYYRLHAARSHLVRGLIYPVPDPRFPFLGVHFTRRVNGEVDAGPNAVLALKREGYSRGALSLLDLKSSLGYPGFYHMAAKYWKEGAAEVWRSMNKRAFVAALRTLVPELAAEDLVPGGCGIRAQALDAKGVLLDDFAFYSSRRTLHVCNVPSPAATASLPLGRVIADKAAELLALQ